MRRTKLKAAVYRPEQREQELRDFRGPDGRMWTHVENPHFNPLEEQGVLGNNKYQAVPKADDVLAGMRSRGQIEIWQYEAGREWQKLYEQSESGGVRAFDFTREAVDGGQVYQPFDDIKQSAIKELNRAQRHLGAFFYSIIMNVLGRRLPISLLAPGTQREREFHGQSFRKALEMLAELWGFKSQPGPVGVIR